jgi:hypothetical protein
MPRATRIAVVAVLALAIAALPIVLDHCTASCEMHRHTAVETTAGCHHLSPPHVRISSPPSPCGHDHTAVVATSAVAPAKHANVLAHSLPACSGRIAAPDAGVVSSADYATSSPPTALPIALILPLRI